MPAHTTVMDTATRRQARDSKNTGQYIVVKNGSKGYILKDSSTGEYAGSYFKTATAAANARDQVNGAK